MMRHVLQDLRFGLRTVANTPGFTAIAILVLAVGIGVNSAMFSLVNALLIKPLAGDADALVGLYSHDRTKPASSYRAFSYDNYVDIRRGNDVFESLMAHSLLDGWRAAGRRHAPDLHRGRLVELLRRARRSSDSASAGCSTT